MAVICLTLLQHSCLISPTLTTSYHFVSVKTKKFLRNLPKMQTYPTSERIDMILLVGECSVHSPINRILKCSWFYLVWFFLWGYVKDSVYKTRPTIVDNMREIIVAAFRGRTPHMPFKMKRSFWKDNHFMQLTGKEAFWAFDFI